MKRRAPLSAEQLRDLAAEHGSWSAVARSLGIPASTVRDRAMNLGIRIEDFQEEAATRSVTSDMPAEWGDIRRLIESRGLDPTQFLVSRVRVNEWGDEKQLRVDLEPTTKVVLPARTDGWKPPKKPKPITGRPKLTVVCSDHHVPHQSRPLHEAFVAWLREHRPDVGIINGDFLNMGDAGLTRHRLDPARTETLQSSIDMAWGILRDYVEASPGTKWKMLAGNHEDRLRNTILDQLAGVVHGVRQADSPDSHPVLSIPHLLRLDELQIEYVGGDDDYRHWQIEITPTLACRHGWIASKGSGSSALKTLRHLNYSVIVGHTHRQSQVFASSNRIDGTPVTLLAAETGTMAEVDATGLGYAPSPDWQNGFVTVSSWRPTARTPDGTFKVDLGTYVSGRLMWRDWSCEPE